MFSEMSSEVAYVKLGWVLGHGLDAAEEMPKNYLGEVSKRTEEGFGVGTLLLEVAYGFKLFGPEMNIRTRLSGP